MQHLGHVLSHDLSDAPDIIDKTKDLAKKANYMLHTFSCCDRLTKSTLFMSFCLSLSGSAIWSLACPQLKSLEVTFNNILRKIWGLPRRCHTSLYSTLSLIPSFFMMCSIRAPNWHIVSLATIVFLDGSTLNFTLNKILFVPVSCVMSSLTRHSIALLSVMTFFLPAVHSLFISYLYVFVHCICFCIALSSSLLSFLLVNLLLL